MKLRTMLAILCCMSFVFLYSCGRRGSVDSRPGTAVVGIQSDVDNFNPVISTNSLANQLNTALYPLLFDEVFDMGEGRLLFKPSLARSWDFRNDGKDVVLHLRNDVKWQDGVPVTAEDVKFSFGLYGNPDVGSARRNYIDNMILTDGVFDLEKSITVIDDTTLIFHFTRPYAEQLYHINLMPVPRHIFHNAVPKSLANHPANSQPLSAGPLKLLQWTRLQEIVMGTNPRCTLPYPAKLDRIVFRIMTEATTRLTELEKGDLDMLWPVYPENVKEITDKYPDIRLVTLPPRAYDFISWANIDFARYRESNGKEIKPHPLFGSKRVRQALTYAINRQSIIDGFLGEYGEPAITSISPVFRWALNMELKPYPYDPRKAREMLNADGWQDSDGDGILDKGGRKFSFTLAYNAGNSRRAYAATVIQNNLKQVGIEVRLESVEGNIFFSKLQKKEWDAALAGFSVGLAIDPTAQWSSDLRSPFNTAGFANRRVDELLTLAHNVRTDREEAPFWKELQAILHEEQPVTFLYWYKDIVAVNRRLDNANPNILGALDGIWNWTIRSSR